MRRPGSLQIVFFGLFCGCGRGDPAPAKPLDPAASARPSAAPTSSAEPPRIPVTKVFHEVLRSTVPLSFSSLGAVSFVHGGEVAFRVENDRFVQDPADSGVRSRFYGAYPKDVVGQVVIERAEMEVHIGAGKLEGRALVSTVTPAENETTRFLVQGHDGEWLAGVFAGKTAWRLANVSRKGGPAPATTVGEAKDALCKNPLVPDEAWGRGDGTIVAAGFPCDAQKTDRRALVARWTDAAKEATVSGLDDVKNAYGRMLVQSRKGQPVYLAHELEAYLAVEDGSAWKRIEVPGPISSLAVGPDGTVFVAVSGQLHERHGDEAFAVIPTPFAVDAVWVADDGKLWLTAPRIALPDEEPGPPQPENPQARALFTDAFAVPAVATVPLPAAVDIAREQGWELGTAACSSLYVRVLTGVRKGQAFPVLKEIVKQVGDVSKVRFVLDETGAGKLALAAVAPDLPTAIKVARALMPPASKASSPKAKQPLPRVFCRVPVERGVVTVDP